MFALLLSASVFVAADDKPKPEAVSLEGNWTVLCAEKNGQSMGEIKDMKVSVKGDTITCSGKDGKPSMSCKLEFGPNGTVKVTEMGEKQTTKNGVYVLTKDYFSLCVHEGGSASDPAGKPDAKSYCTFVLKREGSRP